MGWMKMKYENQEGLEYGELRRFLDVSPKPKFSYNLNLQSCYKKSNLMQSVNHAYKFNIHYWRSLFRN